MSKHPLDHGRSGSSERSRRFTAQDLSDKPSAATIALQQRAKNEPDSRLEKFTEIERGIET